MKIIVCIKQVPALSEASMDKEKSVLVRTGENKLNPYDLPAIETALRLREALGGEVTALTMGPESAEQALRTALAMTADYACLMSDRAFAGADVLMTARTLAQGIKALGGADLIICGQQTTDGDTAQVGPAIAEYLGIPHAAWVSRLTVSGDGVDAEQQLQDVIETVHMPFPCLVTVEQDICMPRLPSLKTAKEIGDKPIHIQGLDSFLDTDETHYGLTGSATQVERIFPPVSDTVHEQWSGEGCAAKLCDQLKKWKFV